MNSVLLNINELSKKPSNEVMSDLGLILEQCSSLLVTAYQLLSHEACPSSENLTLRNNAALLCYNQGRLYNLVTLVNDIISPMSSFLLDYAEALDHTEYEGAPDAPPSSSTNPATVANYPWMDIA